MTCPAYEGEVKRGGNATDGSFLYVSERGNCKPGLKRESVRRDPGVSHQGAQEKSLPEERKTKRTARVV